MTAATSSRNGSILFYEITPTGILSAAQRAARAVGFDVSVRAGRRRLPSKYSMIVAHCATNAWRELADSSPAGSVCMHVSSVRREHVERPQWTSKSAALIELVPAVSEVTDLEWKDILCGLSSSQSVDLLIRSPAESPLARFFATVTSPLVLCSLLLLAQAYFDAPREYVAEMGTSEWWLNAFGALSRQENETLASALTRKVEAELDELAVRDKPPSILQFVSEVGCPGRRISRDQLDILRVTLNELLYPLQRNSGSAGPANT